MEALSRWNPTAPTTVPAERQFVGTCQKIAGMFAQGNFSLPMFIHDTIPPGVEAMKRLKHQIVYKAENTAKGAQVRIVTGNPEALAAVHEFLRFQIKDHRTNDPLAIQVKPES